MALYLAQEIIHRIIHFLINDNILGHPDGWWKWVRVPGAGQYAAVSRIWQHLIERETFSTLRLDLARLVEVNSIVDSRRRAYVRTIQLDIVLPAIGPLREPETLDEKQANGVQLQATLEAFLQSLGPWSAAETFPKGIDLFLDAWAPGSQGHDEKERESWIRARRERRHAQSIIELPYPERIAQCPRVTAIVGVRNKLSMERRNISPVAMCALIERLPRARIAFVDWYNCTQFSSLRNDIANAISKIKSPIDEFRLNDSSHDFLGQSESDILASASHRERRGVEAEEEGVVDKLSNTIRVFSQRAETVELHGLMITDEIFFPRAIRADMVEPRWDRLQYFYVDFLPITPSGEWLFVPDPNNLDSDSENESLSSSAPSGMSWVSATRFRRGLATPAMQRFHASAARAALQMPALRHMTLEASLNSSGNWHIFEYFSRGLVAEATWESSSEFVPDDEVLERWRKVARKHLKTDLAVTIHRGPET